jgi:uncharacterized protein (TIGR00255 family)
MLLSMTGYGEARRQSDSLSLSVEIRALNNRYLKVTVRAPEPYNLLEAEFEKIVRREIRRGTVQIHLRIERQAAAQDYRINTVALRSYLDQLRHLGLATGGDQNLIGPALALPGVVGEPGSGVSSWHDDWPIVEKTVAEALAALQNMRREEGKAMAEELIAQRNLIARHLQAIRERSPEVVRIYQERLRERVKTLLAGVDVTLDSNSVLREVAIFAERSDIAEEVVRLATHLDQFLEVMKEKDGPGRKLEFLLQEMSRETNTIGSKANDVGISKEVVAIKHTLEQIRELIQNVE